MTGTTIATRAACLLTMHGLSRPVTAALTARRDGSLLEVAGRLPVAFARWRVSAPAGFWPLASLADHGTAEFLLVLSRPSARTQR